MFVSPLRMTLRQIALTASIVASTACTSYPADVRYSWNRMRPQLRATVPPQELTTWWTELSRCAGRSSPLPALVWFAVPGIYFDVVRQRYAGFYFADEHAIVVAEGVAQQAELRANLLRHELLHVLLDTADHPAEFFERRCGSLVRPGRP